MTIGGMSGLLAKQTPGLSLSALEEERFFICKVEEVYLKP
jgi:hypothetical protein